jgi:hypothetical protein
MPAFTILPSANSTPSAWSLIAGSSKWNAMRSADGSSSYIRAEDTALGDAYVMEDLPAEADSISGDVTHTIQAQDPFSNGALTVAHGGAGASFGTSTLTGSAFSSYAKTLGGLTVAALNSNKGQITSGGGGQPGRINASSLSMSGTYLVAAGGFVPLFFGIAGLLGSGLLLADMPQITKAASLVSPPGICKSRILPREYEIALREWRAHRHPAFFLLGRD